jgi:SSS family solute:Na+ symporter/sodium/pantothenate symporter
MPDATVPTGGYSVFFALLAFMGASIWLGTYAQRRIDRSTFLQGYFLGNRSLGAWALALTATVQSGGTFMGFPALAYSHGWAAALWIAGYMMVPITGFAVIGKRMAQLSRRTGAITVPDLIRERYDSPAAGLIASLLIIALMSCMMVAQFKAGAIVMKLAWPSSGAFAQLPGDVDWAYLTGLAVFAAAVVGYTMVGGFLASVWTDLFQSLMMLLGVMILLFLTVPSVGGLEQATREAVAVTDSRFAFAPGYDTSAQAFLPVGLAVSFFCVWVFSGIGSPASLVRVMASDNTNVLRKSIVLLAVYNCLIYLPLVAICVAGRALIPHLDKPDEIMPRLALTVTDGLPGGTLISGLILAAPFGAVMATVSCYLLVISSGLVKDLYLRFVRPNAGIREIRLVTYFSMALVGALAIAANIQPVKYLQVLVVLSGTSSAATFVACALMMCYWRRATAAGTIAAMLSGAGTIVTLFSLGWLQRFAEAAVEEGTASTLLQSIASVLGPDLGIGIADPFSPYYLLGLHPILWGLPVSAVAGVLVSLCTKPPDPGLIALHFNRREPGTSESPAR